MHRLTWLNFFQKIPEDRNWTLNTRKQVDKYGTESEVLEWSIYDPQRYDAGIYECIVKYYISSGIFEHSGQQYLATRGKPFITLTAK